MKKRAKLSKRKLFELAGLLLGMSIVSYIIGPSKIVGFSISLKENIANIPNSAVIIVAGVWAFFIALFIVAFLRDKLTSKKQITTLNVSSRYGKYKTDLDVLYEVLKENKILKIKILSKAFNITNEKAMEWSKILESGHLATIEYPGILGDPEVRLVEEKKEEIEDKAISDNKNIIDKKNSKNEERDMENKNNINGNIKERPEKKENEKRIEIENKTEEAVKKEPKRKKKKTLKKENGKEKQKKRK